MPTSRFNPFPVLTTERLVLRKILPSDDQPIYLQRSNEIVNKYIARVPAANVNEAQAWIARINKSIDEGININWAITLKDSGTFIGLICLWNFSDDRAVAEAGYELTPSYHGKGYMNEALQCILDYGFSTLNLSAVKAYTHRENANSLHLLKKNGFVWSENETDEDVPHNVIYVLSK